jgi:hypothetical protein
VKSAKVKYSLNRLDMNENIESSSTHEAGNTSL